MDKDQIILEFFDNESYNFYTNLNLIKKSFLDDFVQNTDEELNNIKLIEIGNGRYIFHNNSINLCCFVSTNSLKIINYCLKLLSNDIERERFLHSIYSLDFFLKNNRSPS